MSSGRIFLPVSKLHGLFSFVFCNCALLIQCRARLTATVYTAEQLLAMVQDWASSDGTFLFNYHGRIRLRVNPLCQPLAIDSFTEPECGQSVADVNSKIFPPFLGVV